MLAPNRERCYVFRPDCCTSTLVDADTTRNTLRIDGPCIYCKKPQSVTVSAAKLIEYAQGGLLQDCLSELSANQREFLLSGTCGECWDKMFPEEDEETPAEE